MNSFKLKTTDSKAGPVVAIAVTGKARRVAVARKNRMVEVFSEADVCIAKHKEHRIAVDHLAISDDGQYVVSLSEMRKRGLGMELLVWNLNGKSPVQLPPFSYMPGYRSPVIANSHNHLLIDSGELHAFNLATRKRDDRYSNRDLESEHLAVSPDGAWIASASERKIRVIDLNSYRVAMELTEHSDYIDGLAFSTDGSLVGSLSSDDTIRIWDLQSGKSVGCLHAPASEVFHFGYSDPHNRWILIDRAHGCRSLSVQEAKLSQHELQIDSLTSAVAFDRTTATIAIGNASGSVTVQKLRLKPTSSTVLAEASAT